MQNDEEIDNEDEGSRRDSSSIAWPYMDLDIAEKVAIAVYQRTGLGPCELDSLAAEMGHTVNGAFRVKLATARTFGLIAKATRNSVQLTELGRMMVAEETTARARAEAFLGVPLYNKIFETYRGHRLPPARAIESEMVSLGVAAKQKERARQAFERSAKQAGFFEDGADRLVRPRWADHFASSVVTFNPGIATATSEKEKAADVAKVQQESAEGFARTSRPFIDGLLSKLPDEGSAWSSRDRVKWLKAAIGVFDLIYTGDDSQIQIRIVAEEVE
jgi:hypothetical protein